MSASPDKIEGECFCGAIHYEIGGALGPARCCHCSRCRKAFSGAGSAIALVSGAPFRWTAGEEHLKTYLGKHGSGLAFCGICGTTLCGYVKEEVFCVTLGTLNDNPDVTITEHIFTGSKACWDDIGGEAPQYEEWPPRRG